MYTLLRGYILLTPESPAVRKLTKMAFAKLLQNLGNSVYEFSDTTYNNSSLQGVYRNMTHPYERNLADNSMIKLFQCFRTDRLVVVENETVLENMGSCLMDADSYLSGLVFDVQHEAKEFRKLTVYKIRMANYLVDNTNHLQDRTLNSRPRDSPFIDLKYEYFGFSFLQDAVSNLLIDFLTSRNQSETAAVFSQQFPAYCYTVDLFMDGVSNMLPFIISIGWIFSAAIIIKNIVLEKELRIKEFLKMMGLNNFIYWLSCFIQSFLILLFTSTVAVVILKVSALFHFMLIYHVYVLMDEYMHGILNLYGTKLSG
ncbi:unnamed protein product [Soboliphyme baturini]|uniref:ATP-binding cassette sub-family A member 3 n=1 Tax=Soboliphyme baturini TaxID=241478 RepID=A0A183IQI0_9BILA|nr:unnamed protein product [Soboliphyme baturini]